jgi:hypothetical protein
MVSRREENRSRLNALVENLADKACTPFLGSGASAPYIPTGADMALTWARRYKYPFPDTSNLARVMQFVATTQYGGDGVSLKQRLISEHIASAPDPDFTAPDQVHSVLADCGLPLYVTTNYDDYMFRVLERAPGRTPRRGISPWYMTDPNDKPANPLIDLRRYTPSEHEPLVYHLHGHFSEPRSLVLTDDDNIDYLVREAGDSRSSSSALRVLPDYVRGRLRTTSLLFLGYSLQDWTFHVLFRRLLAGSPQKRNHVSIQLNPGHAASGPACKYLEQYLASQQIWIFWETTEEFMKKLSKRLKSGGRL